MLAGGKAITRVGASLIGRGQDFNSIFLCKHKHPQKLLLSYRNTVSVLSRQVLCQQVKALSPDSLWAGKAIHQPGPHTDNSCVSVWWGKQLSLQRELGRCWLARRLWEEGTLALLGWIFKSPHSSLTCVFKPVNQLIFSVSWAFDAFEIPTLNLSGRLRCSRYLTLKHANSPNWLLCVL